ncbi:hypothetical protein CR513_41439, partial [Mucuna pruriens]
MALFNLRQGEGKSLHSFMAQFLVISVKIHNLNLVVALHFMFMVLKVGPPPPPETMDDLSTKATRYIQMEEMVEFCDSARAGQSSIEERLTLRVGRFRKARKSKDLPQTPFTIYKQNLGLPRVSGGPVHDKREVTTGDWLKSKGCLRGALGCTLNGHTA